MGPINTNTNSTDALALHSILPVGATHNKTSDQFYVKQEWNIQEVESGIQHILKEQQSIDNVRVLENTYIQQKLMQQHQEQLQNEGSQNFIKVGYHMEDASIKNSVSPYSNPLKEEAKKKSDLNFSMNKQGVEAQALKKVLESSWRNQSSHNRHNKSPSQTIY